MLIEIVGENYCLFQTWLCCMLLRSLDEAVASCLVHILHIAHVTGLCKMYWLISASLWVFGCKKWSLAAMGYCILHILHFFQQHVTLPVRLCLRHFIFFLSNPCQGKATKKLSVCTSFFHCNSCILTGFLFYSQRHLPQANKGSCWATFQHERL